ncbi:MAG: gfo/Idh/MocA family oxidoreductase [Spirochaetaceae bacterium]|nr:MAG: gfo/Idh/MocA family oxidoreductase [Spirochaetaceae bacterium]
MPNQSVRWGVIGSGNIAHAFARGIALVADAELLAAASRTPGRAEEFAATHLVPKVYTHYEQLVTDSDVDAVYVATTHNFHFENAMLALEYGKHVLCEKPITINAAQLEQLAAKAADKGLFLMEALWTRFLPGIRTLRELLNAEVVGPIHLLHACLGIDRDNDPDHRVLNPLLAGGALLDLGIYPLNFAHIVFGGAPEATTSLAYLGPTGVDETSGYLLRFSEGRLAVLASSCRTILTEEASLYGKRGVIRVERFLRPSFLHVETESGRKSYDVRYPSSGFQYEIEEATRCILEGRNQSDIMPITESLAVMRTMDRFRSDWGLRYPDERT